jgi:hypothetical protein
MRLEGHCMTKINYRSFLPRDEKYKEKIQREREVLWEEETTMEEAKGYHLSTIKSHGGEIHDMNRDKVGIPILIEITHDDDYNGVTCHRGVELMRHNEVSNKRWCWKKRAILQYKNINFSIYIFFGYQVPCLHNNCC